MTATTEKQPLCIDCKRREADPHGPRCQLCYRLNYRREKQPRWNKLMETFEAILLDHGNGALARASEATGISPGILGKYRRALNSVYDMPEHILILQEYCQAELVKRRARSLET